jgi:hypothetical protein
MGDDVALLQAQILFYEGQMSRAEAAADLSGVADIEDVREVLLARLREHVDPAAIRNPEADRQ